MSGQILNAWHRTWKELWVRLAKSRGMPEDIFTILVSFLFIPRLPDPPAIPPITAFNQQGELVEPVAIAARDQYARELKLYNHLLADYETARGSENAAKKFFKQKLAAISDEAGTIRLLEATHYALTRHVSENAANRFHDLVQDFLLQFNLRYELRKPFALNATLSGVFSTLVIEVKNNTILDAHLSALMKEFEESYADLRSNRTQARMKTCLQKQYNLLEGLGRSCPNVTANTLGAICDQLDWPHEKVKEVGKNLYRFGSDYPGVRHAGTPANALRDLHMKDFLSLSLMLAAFTPYVADGLDPDRCYGG